MKSSSLTPLVLAALLVAGAANAQDRSAALQTRAERTNFQETARYDEVWDFTNALAAVSERIHQTTFGFTTEGRALPLVIFGDISSTDPAAVRQSGKTRVYIQANIHAGEVCGKDAMLLLLRDLADGQHGSWADSLIVLVAPIYNADGNERFNLMNRGVQNGPVGGMGQRPNAGDYDLNRDHMKLDSPEARSLVGMINDYDPHVLVDLHTTNGTYHAYHLTYSPPLHPNTPSSINALLRERWLPAVTTSIREKYGWDYYYYGNVPRRGEAGWYTFDHRPRFSNNYAGLRNRIGILSEAYAYLPYRDRVLATKYFVEEIAEYTYRHASTVRAIAENADRESVVGKSLALTADFKKSAAPVDILMGEVEEIRNPYSGERLLNRLDVTTPVSMYEYGSFSPVQSGTAPVAYAIPAAQEEVLNRLRMHGIRTRLVAADSSALVQRFKISATIVSEETYQGHNAVKLEGSLQDATVTIPAGTVLVRMNQPLGRLAFSLLEPMSDDGFLSWGLVDLPSGGESFYPIWRLTGK